MIRVARALLASTLVLVAGSFLAPLAQADDNVIPDANLKACLNTSINRAADTAITEAELSSWSGEMIDCSNKNIASLEGMQYFNKSYPAWFDLGDNQITSISPLAGLNIGQLDVYNNKITDMSTVATLPGLVYLSLAGNMITDPSPMSGLPNLMYVGLMNNKISDISGLTDLPRVASLALSGNQISDVSPLTTASAPNLSNLSLDQNAISDLSPLDSLYADHQIRISALDQQVRLADAVVGEAQPVPTVKVVGQDPSLYKPVPVLDGHTLAMTPSSTTNLSIDSSSGAVTYSAAGVYEWTWVAGAACGSDNPAMDPTCWPYVNYSGTATITVTAPGTEGGTSSGTEGGTGGTDGDKEGSNAGNGSITDNPTAAPTGGTVTSATPLVGVLFIAMGMAILVVRRHMSHSTR